MEVDYSLYLVTDRSFLKDKSLQQAVEESILGGVTLVQLREKDASTREFYEIAKEVKKVTDHYKVPFLINDRLDIAQAVDADGVHLGQSDMPINTARKILGKDKIIGISAGNVDEALEAEKNGADYIGIGTIFFTGTKKDIDTPIGIEGLRKIYSSINIPAVAIGGVNETNFKEVFSTGVDGISVISAILGKSDITAASKALCK
ncbi:MULTISPECIES: thiamine phosphate synthase [Clostridium]|uniref:Thiamine-phosphate synthase n=4 Tax=Clostridium TaxID=1485 RepID=D8GRI4_CLOLD|nr:MULTISPECIES: thiamine phosphate synthase [Clostridium]ADK16352.1 thiamine-phosphate pyrophosphorylase [Clostridium ljungdahlii DSM 13528]AGY75429.1 thiamine phosphate synthase [Clostridium autoethanogenum DSM 10061]ALU35595.1 Thiamine-phosphate pyrophosphorylase [Clostridium autoethanogenum DSM 10061]OAA89774.1 Thiamine-phosphate synthase [Clostridium ljungdahlii DSM 13528]OAA94665.1 Thiamine-phosphate synthase [Clostridium coskatii]